MRKVIIIGAGGHGQVVADILQCPENNRAAYQPIGFLDDDPKLAGKAILNLPVLGSISSLEAHDFDEVIVAIGNNETRMKIFDSLCAKSVKFANAVHPHGSISPSAELGKGAMVCAGVVVNPASAVGDNVILNTGCTIDHHNRIGVHAHIAPGVHLGGEVEIGEGALIGIGATVLPGCVIGAWAIVGAGAVVTKDIPDYATAVGVPARIIKYPSRG